MINPLGVIAFRTCARRCAVSMCVVAGLILTLAAYAPPVRAADEHFIIGSVTDSKSGDALEFAAIRLFRLESPVDSVGTPAGGIWTREDGTYQLVAEPGRYNIQVTYISYRSATAYGVAVEADTTHVDFALLPEGILLDEVAVVEEKIRGGEIGALRRQEKAAAVSDAITAEQIEKSTDSNAAEALTRVTGLTVVGGKYIFVRGLGERYSSTQINGAAVSSPEPNKRVVPLDMFASGLLADLTVQKTYTPDQPGEFAGGVVNVSTLDFPTRRMLKASVSVGHRAATTGESYYTYGGGHTDWLGIDDGARTLPDIFKRYASDKRVGPTNNTPEEIEELGEALSLEWTPKRTVADPAYSASASFGDQYRFLGKKLGFVASGTLSNGYGHREETHNQYVSDGDSLSTRTSFEAERSERSVLWGALANSTLELSDHTVLRLQNMYNRSAEDEVLTYEGFDGAADFETRVTRLRYVERGIYTGSAELEHAVPFMPGVGEGGDRRVPTLSWRYGYSDAERNEPDRRQYSYEVRRRDDGDVWFLTRRVQNLTRLFGETNDLERTFSANLEIPLPMNPDLEPKIKVGYYTKRKDRDTSYRRFRYRTPDGLTPRDLAVPIDSILTAQRIGGTTNSFQLTEITQPTDGYQGSVDIDATYVMLDAAATSRLRLVGGVRWENARLAVDTFSPFSESTPTGEDTSARLRNEDALPAAGAIFALGEGMNLRANYSRTVTRPDLRELSPFALPDFQGGFSTRGNAELQRTRIENYDLRWELYPRRTNELFAVSGFYKAFDKPVETALSGDAVPLAEPVNTDEAELYGVELEMRLALARLWPSLNEWGVTGNLTLVDSETKVTNSFNETTKRPLTGQSPYVVNAGVFMQTSSGATAASLMYNIFGRRLAYLGIGQLPDIYEQPRTSLDAKFSLAHGLVKVGFENILNRAQEFKQDGVQDDDPAVTTDKFRTGRNASVSISYQF